MSGESQSLSVLGVDVAFRQGADMERARAAARMVEKLYAEQKARGGKGKDALLVYVALGLADDLIQARTKREDTGKRIELLLEKIEKSV